MSAMQVWVLDFDVTELDGSFLTGNQSVHASEKSAARRLFDLAAEAAGDAPPPIIPEWWVGHRQSEHGTSSAAADLELPDGRQVHYAITPYDVEELA